MKRSRFLKSILGGIVASPLVVKGKAVVSSLPRMRIGFMHRQTQSVLSAKHMVRTSAYKKL